jgi:hypothetical protein
MSKEEQDENEQACLELFQRALGQNDVRAWELLQRRFSGMMRRWLRRHPQRERASRYESEENYIALGFERFWYATACKGQVQFGTLASALDYLRASLNSVVLDTLRAHARLDVIPLPEPGHPNEPGEEDQHDPHEMWEVIQSLLPDEREQRVAYLFYYCGLKPRQIIRFCPQEWSSVQEIYRVRRRIIERFVRSASTLRWRLEG